MSEHNPDGVSPHKQEASDGGQPQQGAAMAGTDDSLQGDGQLGTKRQFFAQDAGTSPRKLDPVKPVKPVEAVRPVKPVEAAKLVKPVKPQIEPTRTFRVPPSFSIRAVDFTAITSGLPGDDKEDPVAEGFEPLAVPHDDVLKAQGITPTSASEAPPVDNRRLGGLDEFTGNFHGNGLNIIFRPRNNHPVKTFQAADDNLLEINITKEELQFLNRDILDAIPNRGFGTLPITKSRVSQPDVMLRGIPYMQRISDLIDQTSLTLREPGVAIHFEQGLFLRTPALQRPEIGATISRLASIPHGSTINAQCLDPGFDWIPGKPEFPREHDIDITPFRINGANPGVPVPGAVGNTPGRLVPFPNMDPRVATRNRLPNKIQPNESDNHSELKNFKDIDAIKNFLHPVETLRNYNNTKEIVKHRTFEVNTLTGNAIPGGGTTNIAHLQAENNPLPGKAETTANANAVRVTCRYWISVVKVMLKVGPTAHSRVEVQPAGKAPIPKGVTYIHPTFIVPLKKPLLEEKQFEVNYVQIQYAQNVTLDFGPLSWPHVSVASLIPAGLDMSGKIELFPEQLPAELR